jgi:hypothetical protein
MRLGRVVTFLAVIVTAGLVGMLLLPGRAARAGPPGLLSGRVQGEVAGLSRWSV